ncbi:protein trichome birefringence-like 34 isoform X2 [Salvia miltiorrhiza]|uniref:protein trichome birefringence-like 34 isoform X2 n=1 Tax=Salvia miltiorrhiza TaxID=226208 RepID=UPI0025AD5170|nr:protein trichome birefringence-like 34 isoform X2 [Salvia miltiorrhiza]
MSCEREKMRWMKSAFLGSIFVATLLTIALHQTNNLHLVDTFGFLLEDQHHPQKQNDDDNDGCDLFSGRWVFDDVNYPLYEEGKCSFMKNEFACQKHGRKNVEYQQWAWKPHNCQLPRFDGRKLMEKIRGKRVVFVGDSLNRKSMDVNALPY